MKKNFTLQSVHLNLLTCVANQLTKNVTAKQVKKKKIKFKIARKSKLVRQHFLSLAHVIFVLKNCYI
jgi:hypothetical protein